MTRLTPPTPRTRQARRERGTVILLTVVAVIALAVLGISFVQVARVQREVVTEPTNNIDQVMQSVINRITIELKDDVVTTAGVGFGAGIEPYDYPVTNYGSPPLDVDGAGGVGSAGTATYGEYDDAWLADTVPTFTGTPSGLPEWRKITTLTGGYYPSDTTGSPDPLKRDVEDGVQDTDVMRLSNAPGEQYDADIQLVNTDLVDTDGDGIGDARWERVPQPDTVIDGYEYFMAVRIIDASSLLNIYAATVATGDGQNASVAGDVTGYFPTSLDMSRLAYLKMGNNWANVTARLDQFFGDDGLRDLAGSAGVIVGADTNYPTPFGMSNLAAYNPSQRFPVPAAPPSPGYGNGTLSAWLEGAAVPGNLSSGKYLSPLFELHWRGGVNNIDTASTHAIEDQLGYDNLASDMLGDPYDLDTYSTDPIRFQNGTAAGYLNVEEHFTGGPGNIAYGPYAFDSSIRQMLTSISGHAAYSPNYGNMHGGFETTDDLVYRQSGIGASTDPENQQVRAERFRERLKNIFALAGGFPDSDTDNQADAAAGYAAMIAEYSDTNTAPSAAVEGRTDVWWYGLEPLPFLREVYVQVAYEDENGIAADGIDTWDPVTQSHGIVLEIGNPFDRPLTLSPTSDPLLATVRFAIFVGHGSAENNTPMATYILNDGLGGNLTMQPRDNGSGSPSDNEERIFYSSGSDTTGESGETFGPDVTDIYSNNGSPPTFTPVNMGDDLLDGTGAGGNFVYGVDYTFALQVLKPGGNTANDADWVTYDRLTAESASSTLDMRFPNDVDFDPPAIPPAAKTSAYIQKSLRRSGTGLRYISNFGKMVNAREPNSTSNPDPTTWPEDTGGYKRNVDRIGFDSKGTAGDPALNNIQLPSANRPIFSVAELAWIPMFGFSEDLSIGATPGIGDFPQWLSGPHDDNSGRIPPEEQFLLFDDSGNGTDATVVTINNPTGVLNDNTISFAEVILSDFTTLHPGYDGQNNDGFGGSDDPEENLIFGTMNVNTAPEHLLHLAMPYPGTAAQIQQLVQVLKAYPVASVGQFIKLANDPSITGNTNTAGAPQYDLYPMFEEKQPALNGGQEALVYTNQFTAESAVKKGQFLPQALSVRSDIFIAYIVVKGYPNNGSGIDTSAGPKESGRAIVVFDRSGMTGGPTDVVREIGRYSY